MSDFWADLQRWTEAQVAAILRGRIVARRKDYLASDINKLLRDRINEPLAIKVGDKVLAEFLRTAGRAPPKYVLPIGPVEHGWLTGSTGAWTIYTWSSLAAYLAGQGISIGADGEYATTITGRVTPTDRPHLYSGLARLMVQSLVGAGRALSALMPSGWTADPLTIGCIRSPSGVYWLTKASSAGIFAARLSTPVSMADVAALAESGTLSGWDQERADAWVLGMQELADGPDIVELVASADTDLTEFYADYKANLVWGWCWRYQSRGAADEHISGALSTNYRARNTTSPAYRYVSFDCYTQLAKLDISWALERPSGNITLEAEHAFWMGDQTGLSVPTNKLLFVTGDQQNIEFRLANRSQTGAFSTTDPPYHVAAWYDESGARKDITWNPSSIFPDLPAETSTTVSPSGAGYDPLGAWTLPYFPIYTFSPYNITRYEGEKKISAWERGYYSVGGIRLNRKQCGLREWYSVDLTITGGPYPDPFPTTFRHQYEYSNQAESYLYEHCVLSDVPGVAWLVAQDETFTYSYHDCAESDSVNGTSGAPTEAGKRWYVNELDPCVNDYFDGTSPIQGLAVVDGVSYNLTELISDSILSVIDTTFYYAPTKALTMPAADGYGPRSNVKGASLPAGLDIDGAALAGRWIGAA
jgi:hypothetical protein